MAASSSKATATTAKTQTTTKIADLPKELIISDGDKPAAVAVKGRGLAPDVLPTEPGMITKVLLDFWNMSGSRAARRAAVIRFFQPLEYGSGKIVKRTLDSLQQVVFDGGWTCRAEQFLLFAPDTTLKAELDAKVSLRAEGIDHALVGNRLMFWPPPTRSATVTPQASRAWQVEGDADNEYGGVEEEAVSALEEWLGSEVILFRMYTRGLKPTCRWIARPTKDCKATATGKFTWTEPVDEDAVERVFDPVLCCALCSVSSLYTAAHDHTQCPTIGTLDKVREGLGFLKVVNENGVLGFPREKAPVDVGKKFKNIDAAIADLEKRLKAVEDATKASVKKRKTEATEGGSAKKVKKEKGGKAEATKKKGGDNGGSGAAGPSKGKGKAKAT